MTDRKSNHSRRKLLKSIAAGSGAVVAAKSLPESWSKPVINSFVLPAHAQLTDDTGNLPGAGTTAAATTPAVTTPAPLNYFGTDLALNRLGGSLNHSATEYLIAGAADMLISKAHAIRLTLGGMSVIVGTSSATIRFLSAKKFNIHNVVAPIDGSASGRPTLEGGGCLTPDPDEGPQSVQLIAYTRGDASVTVRVNAGNGPGWQVDVPLNPIGNLSIVCT